MLPYDVGDKDWIRASILAKSSGLRDGHIKSIDIGFTDFVEQKFCKPLGQIFRNMPKDTLQRFIWGPLSRPTHEDLQVLWRNHNGLSNLHLDFSLSAPSMADIMAKDLVVLSSLDSISELYVNFGGDHPDPKAGNLLNVLVEVLPTLRKMTLKFLRLASTLIEGTSVNTIDLIHSNRELTHLSLWYVDFDCDSLAAKYEFPALESLELIECKRLAKCLDILVFPKLKSFVFVHDCEIAEEGTSLAILRLLGKIHALRRLIIDCTDCLDDHEAEVGSSISAHADSLESLLITFECYGWTSEPRCFPKAVSLCKGLKQLGFSVDVEEDLSHCLVSYLEFVLD